MAYLSPSWKPQGSDRKGSSSTLSGLLSQIPPQHPLKGGDRDDDNNNNNEYLERLTRTGSKRLHVLDKYILSKLIAYTHARTHTDSHTHARAHTHTRARTHTHTHTRAHTRTHTHGTHTHTRTHTVHARTHTHTHRHTHTHTHFISVIRSSSKTGGSHSGLQDRREMTRCDG